MTGALMTSEAASVPTEVRLFLQNAQPPSAPASGRPAGARTGLCRPSAPRHLGGAPGNRGQDENPRSGLSQTAAQGGLAARELPAVPRRSVPGVPGGPTLLSRPPTPLRQALLFPAHPSTHPPSAGSVSAGRALLGEAEGTPFPSLRAAPQSAERRPEPPGPAAGTDGQDGSPGPASRTPQRPDELN